MQVGFVTEWSWNRNDNFQKQSNETNSTLRQRIQNYHHIKTGSVLLRLNFHDTKKGDTLHCLVGRLERDWCIEAAHAITFCKHFQLDLIFYFNVVVHVGLKRNMLQFSCVEQSFIYF